MDIPGSPSAREEEGNSRQPSSIYWRFTFNNYAEHIKNGIAGFAAFVDKLNKDGLYVFQKEICPETGTPHLQGYVKFNTKRRPNERYKYYTSNGKYAMRWFKSSKNFWNGGTGSGPSYCLKSESKDPADMHLYTNIDSLNQIEVDEPYGWQLKIMEIIKEKPDKRTIHWFWSEKGGVGKTTLAKYLCVNHKALYIGGKADDIKCAVAAMEKKPIIIIMGIPRCTEHISWKGIEEVKDGLFFSGKYESGMCIYNSPHVIVLANEAPDIDKLSKDRWNIVKIDDLKDLKVE